MGEYASPGDPELTDSSEEGIAGTPAGDEEPAEAAAQPAPEAAPPWYQHPYLGVGLIAGGILLAVLGVTRFSAAGSESEQEEAALQELAALEAEEAGLQTDAGGIRQEIESTEAATAATRAEIAATRAEIAATRAEIAATRADIADTEAPIRNLQEEVWDVYAALQRTAELESRVATAVEGAVISGNQRNVDAMILRVEDVRSGQLADLENALAALDGAIADTESMLVGTDTSIEIAEDFEGEPTGWEAGFATNGVAGLADGGYVISTNESLVLMWGISPYEIADVTAEVSARPTVGDDAGRFAYGVLCRAEETDYLSGYLFAVTGEGGYLVGWYEPPGEWVDLLDAGREDRPADDTALSAAVNRGLEQNQISVTCSGPELSFRVNGVTVWEGSDDNLATGRIAFGAYFYGDEAVTVRFDDLRLTGGDAGEEGGS
jgi:hypothetical protein